MSVQKLNLPGSLEVAFDLDARAARLFDVLLDLGRSSVQQLAQAAKTERTGTYDVLNRLLERGLVERHTIGKRTLFQVVAPDVIRLQAAASLASIDALMPELQARYAARTQEPLVRSIAGSEGLQAVVERIELNTASELLILAPSLAVTDIFGGRPLQSRMTQTKKVKPARLLVGAAALLADWDWLDSLVSGLSARQLQPAATIAVGEILFERAVAYLTSDDIPTISLIESAPLAAHQRQLFELLWRAAKPLTIDR